MYFFLSAVLATAFVNDNTKSLPQTEHRQHSGAVDEKRLFVFHVSHSYGTHNESAWRGYPWEKIHTVLVYSKNEDLLKKARAVGANVAIVAGAPSDLGNSTAREQSIGDVISTCKATLGCNSINLDIERSVKNGSAASQDITTFVAELRTAINQAGEKWSLSYDAAARPGYEGRYYDYEGLNQFIDWFFVMDYDLNDYDDPPPWDDHSMANSPAPVVMQGLKEFLELIPADKIVVGLPFYGYEYRGFIGKLPITSREIGLHEISPMLRNSSWDQRFDNSSLTPYITRGDGALKTQVWYDDPASIAVKINISRSLGISLSGCWTGNALDYSESSPIPSKLFWDALYG